MTNVAIVVTLAVSLHLSAVVCQVAPPVKGGGVAVDDPRLAKLPPALRDHGRAILEEPDEDKRADLAESLADTDVIGALDFLLAVSISVLRVVGKSRLEPAEQPDG
jgi:hypothetical protein